MTWNLMGNQWAADMLSKHITEKEIRHAYLFTGPPGLGKRTLALRFAQAINCLQPPAPGQSCSTCRTCRQIERMQQIDLSIVEAEHVGGILKVNQVRELQHLLSLSPYESRYRIAILLRFEEANANAQNALLKTLEEAPEKAILLLTADAAESLLPTITSRCEILRLTPLPVAQLENHLIETWQFSPEQAKLFSHLSNGRPGIARQLNEHPELLEQRQERLDLMYEMFGASRVKRFDLANKLTKDSNRAELRSQIREVLGLWLSFWRDVMITAAGSATPMTNIDWLEQIEWTANRIGFNEAQNYIQKIEKALKQLNANVNTRLLLEVLLLDWPQGE
jgi:DNA polymerase-3 subunit delta'